jgi:hypothetical protein
MTAADRGGWFDTARDIAYIARRLTDVRGNVSVVRALLEITAPDGPLGRKGLVERLTDEGGTLDQFEALNSAMVAVRPILEELGPSVRAVAASPLGDLASLFPGKRRRSEAPRASYSPRVEQ